MERISGNLEDLMEYTKFLRILQNVENQSEEIRADSLSIACTGLLNYCKRAGYIATIPDTLVEKEEKAIIFGDLITREYVNSLEYSSLTKVNEVNQQGNQEENRLSMLEILEKFIEETLKALVLDAKTFTYYQYKQLNLYEFSTFCYFLGMITKGEGDKVANTDGDHLDLLVENIATEDDIPENWWEDL